MLPLLLRLAQEGRLKLQTLVALASATPARLYGLAAKGSIEPGFDADIVLCDTEATHRLNRWDVQSKCGWSPYEGARIGAFPRAVYLRGELAAADGKPVGQRAGRPATFQWKETR